MDKPKPPLHDAFFIKIVALFCLSYIVCLNGVYATSSSPTRISSNRSFYTVSLYKENYILPRHYLKNKIKPRPVTIIRTFPDFKTKLEKRHQKDSAKDDLDVNTQPLKPTNQGHRRKLSDHPDRQARIIEQEEMPTIPPTPQTPIEKKGALLKRTETILKNNDEALKKLNGERSRTHHLHPQTLHQIDQELTEGLEEVFHELVHLLQYDFLNSPEVAFQISLKIPLFYLEKTDTRFYAAYTQQSWWQCYTGVSAFFRESNYMPEFFIEQPFRTKNPQRPHIESLKIGVIHQSNGAGLFLERSWNRLFAELCIRWKALAFTLEPWWILPTKDQSLYNPNIAEYLGHWKAHLQLKHRFFQCSLQVQKSNYQLLASIPISHALNVTFYYFNGKGSTLGLQDQHNSSWGIGIGMRL